MRSGVSPAVAMPEATPSAALWNRIADVFAVLPLRPCCGVVHRVAHRAWLRRHRPDRTHGRWRPFRGGPNARLLLPALVQTAAVGKANVGGCRALQQPANDAAGLGATASIA